MKFIVFLNQFLQCCDISLRRSCTSMHLIYIIPWGILVSSFRLSYSWRLCHLRRFSYIWWLGHLWRLSQWWRLGHAWSLWLFSCNHCITSEDFALPLSLVSNGPILSCLLLGNHGIISFSLWFSSILDFDGQNSLLDRRFFSLFFPEFH